MQLDDISQRAVNLWRDAGGKAWFSKSDEFDAKLEAEFGESLTFLEQQDLPKILADEKDAYKVLGLIICLDQFRRNLNRGSGLAFAFDDQALALAIYLVDSGMDKDIEDGLRMFAHMPYMHSENLAMQEKALELFNNSEFAVIHYDLIKAYGRFPHRNEVLGRENTEAELEFLKTDGFKG